MKEQLGGKVAKSHLGSKLINYPFDIILQSFMVIICIKMKDNLFTS